MKNFWVRTASATVYAILFLGSIYSGALIDNKMIGGAIFVAFLIFVTFGCSFEFFRIVEKQGSRAFKIIGYGYALIALLALVYMAYNPDFSGLVVFGIAMTLLPAAFGISAIIQLWEHSDQPFREAAYSMVPMLYIAIPLGLMPLLHETYNVLVPLIIMVWVNDSAAYMGGSRYGKHKMWPVHSPGKTWEGTITGVVVTMALSILLMYLFESFFPWYHWLVLGFICSAIGTFGDLVESMLKRSVGLKDSGNIMPGHGGFLDRFDSLLIIIPFAFAYITLAL